MCSDRRVVPAFRGMRAPPPAVAATAFLLALVGLYAFAAGTDAGRELDNATVRYYLFVHDGLRDVATALAHLAGIVVLLPAGLALVLFAWSRDGRRPAIAAGALIVGSIASARLLKALLGELQPLGSEWPRYYGPGYFPSGHGAGAMGLVLAAILLARSGRLRAAIALGAGAGVGVVGLTHVVGLSHHPTDLLGGYLLAGAWALGASVYLQRDGDAQRSPLDDRSRAVVPAGAGPDGGRARGGRAALLAAAAVAIGAGIAIAQGVAVEPAAGTFGVPLAALAVAGSAALLIPIRRGSAG